MSSGEPHRDSPRAASPAPRRPAPPASPHPPPPPRRGIFQVPTADNYVRQGVTTIFEGPDGGSPVPLAPFLAKVAATPVTPNFAMFIGQGSIRGEGVGDIDRPATPGETETMKALVRQGMEDGAFGLSGGPLYVPGGSSP